MFNAYWNKFAFNNIFTILCSAPITSMHFMSYYHISFLHLLSLMLQQLLTNIFQCFRKHRENVIIGKKMNSRFLDLEL